MTESSTITWHLDSKAGRGVGVLYGFKKKIQGDFRYALIGNYWHGKRGGRLEVEYLARLDWEHSNLFFFFFFWLVPS